MNRPRLLGGLLACQLALAACVPLAAAPSPSPAPSPTPTPFQAELPTATPAPPRLWLSPGLPPAVRQAAIDSLAGEAPPLVLVDDEASADLRLGAGGDAPLARWVYALAAPFPTLVDSVRWTDVLAAWRGQGPFQLVTDPASRELMAAWLGEMGAVQAYPAGTLVSRAWAAGDTFALIPFDQLEPRWKVIAVQGISPLDPDFEAAEYPLTVSIGLQGEAAGVDLTALQLPATNRDPDRLTMVAITGVTALTRATAWALDREGVDWALREVGPWLAEADLTHVSHEVAFTPECPPVNPSRDVNRFCGQPEQIEVLEKLGVDVVELTGNHVMDYGPEALRYTLDRYQERGWLVYGGGRNLAEGGRPGRVEHNGNRLAFLGCNAAGPSFAWATESEPGSQPCDYDRLWRQIEALRDEGVLPVVTFQWPESYRNWPLPAQAETFRQAAEAGAVIVSGSQAHQPQGFEFLGDSFIHYGLGNLLFDQMWSLETRQETIDRHIFYDGRYLSIVVRTVMLEDYARLRFMTEDERRAFLRTLFEVSGWQVFDLP